MHCIVRAHVHYRIPFVTGVRSNSGQQISGQVQHLLDTGWKNAGLEERGLTCLILCEFLACVADTIKCKVCNSLFPFNVIILHNGCLCYID